MLCDSLDRNVSDVRSAKLAKGWGRVKPQPALAVRNPSGRIKTRQTQAVRRGNSNASTSTIPTARCGPASRVVWEGATPLSRLGMIIINCNQDVTNIYSRHGGAPWREKQPFPTERSFRPTNSETARKPWKRCNGLSPYS